MKKLDKRRRDIIKNKVHQYFVKILGLYLYPSYWHYKIHGVKPSPDLSRFYLTARPNPAAGIGHQLANWIAGLWFSKQFKLKHAHLPFYRGNWESFLGLGEKSDSVKDLVKKGYKLRRIPLFDENSEDSIDLTKQIIISYSGEPVVFLCEQDQPYKDQYGVIDDIKDRFYSCDARNNDVLEYDNDNLNIAIHVRRGDIMTDPFNENLCMRILSNDYFDKVLTQTVYYFAEKQTKPIHIWIFSQGKPEDYPEFAKYNNIHWCLDMSAQDSFLHMVYADVLITSKSSFSYKPALLNNGIKICPKNFWHSYPTTKDWILVLDDGTVIFN